MTQLQFHCIGPIMLYIVNAVEAAFYHIDSCIALSFMKIWSIAVFAHFKMSCMMHVIIFATFYGAVRVGHG